ncbi:MAG TPA: CHRD domain-containing protein, partial [Burkholderiales bacterium]
MRAFSSLKFAAVIGFLWGLVPGVASAEFFTASLSGTDEVPANTSVSTGHFVFNFVGAGVANPYTLRYAGLEGAVTMSHIHIGQAGVNGAITIWLCQTAAAPAPAAVAAATPQCPLTATATVTGTISAAQVLGIAGQLVNAGDLNEVIVRGLRAGNAYVNVHSSLVP